MISMITLRTKKNKPQSRGRPWRRASDVPPWALLSIRESRFRVSLVFFFFFNDTATTEIYTLSLHDALPIPGAFAKCVDGACQFDKCADGDRKSTRLNSSHVRISYAVFCLKKKKKQTTD